MDNTDIPPTVTLTGFSMPSVVANPANAVALPIFAALSLLITYLPLRSFYRVKNIAACSIVFVTNIVNLMTLINTIIWPTDDWTSWWPGYGLCDIEVMFRFPITMALATSLCCLSKGLADALDTEHAVINMSKQQRIRKVIADVLFCWAVPVMQMALHYVVQAGRYMVAPVYGCMDQLDNSWPMLVIIIMWCPIFTLLNVFYAALMLIRLHKHRRTISAALTTTGSGLAPRKFIKLVIISLSLIIIYLPVQTVFVWYAIPKTFVPYSWSRVHNPVTWNPILFIYTENLPSVQWNGWAGIAMATMMFLFFGFNDDAVDSYRKWLVMLGAGRVWPSLKLSREARRGSAGGSATLGSRGSFISHFDLVGKAMKYFDESVRKNSHATNTTLVAGDTTLNNQSRKGSQGPFENMTQLSQITTNASTNPSLLHKNTANPEVAVHSSRYLNDLNDEITAAPSPYGISTISSTSFVHPAATSPVHRNRGMLSVFRTHLHLPFNLFSSKTSNEKETEKTDNEKVTDIEAQSQARNTSTWPRRTSSIPTQTTVSTSIWSSPNLITTTQPNAHSQSHSPFHLPKSASHTSTLSKSIPQDEEFDPHSPKLGTRAYRESERRELAEEKKMQHTRIYAENVRRGMGMEVLPECERSGSVKSREEKRSRGEGLEMGVVVVKTSLVREEEDVGCTRPL